MSAEPEYKLDMKGDAAYLVGYLSMCLKRPMSEWSTADRDQIIKAVVLLAAVAGVSATIRAAL